MKALPEHREHILITTKYTRYCLLKSMPVNSLINIYTYTNTAVVMSFWSHWNKYHNLNVMIFQATKFSEIP